MKKVVFVGDTASKLNVDSSIAFVGAKCFNTLVSWIGTVSPDYYICLNSDTRRSINQIKALYLQNFKVIALGELASSRLQREDLAHFKLPHPSGLNRQLNDTEFVANKLREAKEYINAN